jgi:hypothetical protein
MPFYEHLTVCNGILSQVPTAIKQRDRLPTSLQNETDHYVCFSLFTSNRSEGFILTVRNLKQLSWTKHFMNIEAIEFGINRLTVWNLKQWS